MSMVDIFKSKGVKRNLASLLAAIFAGAMVHPAVVPYAPLLLKIVGILGGSGLLQAAATGNLTIEKDSDEQ